MPGTYDVHFQPLSLPGEVKIFSFAYTSAIGVNSSQKLLNQWLKCFLTEKGSDPSDTQYGTHYPSLIGSNISSFQDIVDVVVLAVDDCNTQIKSYNRMSRAPPDESLAGAEVLSVEPVGIDGIKVRIAFNTVSGARVVFAMPVAPVQA